MPPAVCDAFLRGALGCRASAPSVATGSLAVAPGGVERQCSGHYGIRLLFVVCSQALALLRMCFRANFCKECTYTHTHNHTHTHARACALTCLHCHAYDRQMHMHGNARTRSRSRHRTAEEQVSSLCASLSERLHTHGGRGNRHNAAQVLTHHLGELFFLLVQKCALLTGF